MNLASLVDFLGAPKRSQIWAKIGTFAVFFLFLKKISSAKIGNKVKFCQWFGLLLGAILNEPGKPHGPFGGPEKGSKLGRNQPFAVFTSLYQKINSALLGNEVKFCQWLGLLLGAILDEPGKPH